jgi:hypothetical protein
LEKIKTSHLDHSGHIEGDVMQNHEQKKSENQDFMDKTNYFLRNPALQPLGSFSHMAACRSSLENTWKMSLILVFNKNSPRAHTDSELGALGVHGKLLKYVVHLSKRKNWKNYFSSQKLPKQQSTNFWSQGILGVKTNQWEQEIRG